LLIKQLKFKSNKSCSSVSIGCYLRQYFPTFCGPDAFSGSQRTTTALCAFDK
jgi:hypothetical protein